MSCLFTLKPSLSVPTPQTNNVNHHHIMQLIATRSFRNVASRIKLEGAQHPLHVHKGAIFEIGGEVPLAKIQDERQQELAARLISAKVAVEPTPEVVATIEAELEFDRKHEARAKEMDDAAAIKATGAMFADLIAQASRLAQRSPAPAARAR